VAVLDPVDVLVIDADVNVTLLDLVWLVLVRVLETVVELV
jgi:hypothetical protein